MRRLVVALVSVCALAACGQGAEQQNADAGGGAGGGLFPDLHTASYRAEATLSNQEGESIPVVMVRDGQKIRMEMTTQGVGSTFITNGETGETFLLTNQGGRQMAIRASGMNEVDPADAWQGELAQTATRTGSCSVAGENGAEWTKTTAEDGTDSVCVTEDGIILRATDDGRVVWETTSVQRGPQSAELFALPAGVEATDLGNMGAMMNQALEAAKQRGN
ncbi:MAG: hypothetical protein JNL81_00295 [Hyphomonadaceae bacterium]|nr:hypothetical protein [Hyphomonadaceae bacterium]